MAFLILPSETKPSRTDAGSSRACPGPTAALSPFRGGAAPSPGQEDPGLAAPPHGIEHGERAAATATAAHDGHSHSVHHVQEPGHRSPPATNGHLGSRPRAAITQNRLPAPARGDDARPGRGLEPSAFGLVNFLAVSGRVGPRTGRGRGLGLCGRVPGRGRVVAVLGTYSRRAPPPAAARGLRGSPGSGGRWRLRVGGVGQASSLAWRPENSGVHKRNRGVSASEGEAGRCPALGSGEAFPTPTPTPLHPGGCVTSGSSDT